MFRFQLTIALAAWLAMGLGGCDSAHDSPPPFEGDPDIRVRVIAKKFTWEVQYAGLDGRLGPLRPELRVYDANPAKRVGLDLEHPDSKDDFFLQHLILPSRKKVELIWTSIDVPHNAVSSWNGLDLELLPEKEVTQRIMPSELEDNEKLDASVESNFVDMHLSIDGSYRRFREQASYHLQCGTRCGEHWDKHRALICVCSKDRYETLVAWFTEMIDEEHNSY